MAKRDPYFVLDVPPTSTPDRIRQAYRALARTHHPDLNPGRREVAEEKMKELVEAYTLLIDPDKRKAYDKQPQFQARRFSRRPNVRLKAAPAARKPDGCLMWLKSWWR